MNTGTKNQPSAAQRIRGSVFALVFDRNAKCKTRPLKLLDDEAIAITVSPDDLARTDEDGAQVIVSVALNHAPAAPVRVALDRTPADEWSLDAAFVEFLPEDWDQPRRFTVIGLDDDEFDGAVTGLIQLAPAVSDDARYNGIDAPDLPAVNFDNDIAGDPDPPVDPSPVPIPSLDRLALLVLMLLVLISAAGSLRFRSGARRTS